MNSRSEHSERRQRRSRERSENLWHFHGGLKLPGYKNLSTRTPIAALPAVDRYVVPVRQHIGAVADIVVHEGERVRKGQVLARPHGLVSAAVHAPVSGTVAAVAPHAFPHPSGLPCTSVFIDNDYRDEWRDRVPVGDDYVDTQAQTLRNIIREAGIVGLGGATFPTAVKQTEVNLKTLIINGVECEPYISCDDMLMRERAADVLRGIRVIMHITRVEECFIAIEDNKPQAVEAMQDALDEDGGDSIRLRVVPTIYPSGGERQLIQVITGREVPINGLPADINMLCQNVATAYAVYRAIYLDEPLISRIVTVTGHGVAKPQNLEVAIGTPLKHCIEYCGGYTGDARSLIMGGPMMGFALGSDDLPVVKASNCLLVANEHDMSLPAASPHMPCIRCGKCTEVCPASLLPQQLYWYAANHDYEHAIEHNLFACIECGCCDYVCPSSIPLAQYYRAAKSAIWAQERERKKSDIARQRHEARLERLEKQKREREEKMRKKKEALARKKGKRDSEMDKKKAVIEEALARVNKKKSERSVQPKNTDNLTPEQQQKIEEAEKRRAQRKQNRE